MASQFKLEAEFDTEEVSDWLKELKRRSSDIKNALDKFARVMSVTVFQDVQDHFKQEMGPDGKWTPWSDTYQFAIQGLAVFRRINGRTVMLNPDNMKPKPKPPRKPGMILQDKGKLRNNFTKTRFRTTKGQIVWFNNAKTKTGFPYAAAHDEGGPRLPQRSFMWLSKSALNRMMEDTLKYLAEGETKG
jgi:phage gpG-like protein